MIMQTDWQRRELTNMAFPQNIEELRFSLSGLALKRLEKMQGLMGTSGPVETIAICLETMEKLLDHEFAGAEIQIVQPPRPEMRTRFELPIL